MAYPSCATEKQRNREQVPHSAQTPQEQVLDKVVDMPFVVRRQVTMTQMVLQTVVVQQLQFIDQVFEHLFLTQKQIPMVQTMQKTIEIPQLQHCEKGGRWSC